MTEAARHPETDGTSFDFLGLAHIWGRSRNGRNMVRQVTAKSRFARAVAAVSDWCRKHRHWSIRDQHRHLSSMMRGHFAYYGVGGNIRRLRWFAHQVVRIWQKWLSRRDRQSVVRWTRLNAILKRHPLPPTDTPPRANLSREEPDAGVPHVRVCVQRRLACSAGERPAGARVRSPVVWIAGWRETKTLKPIDNVSRGEATSRRAVTTVNAKVASKVSGPEGRAPNWRAKAAWGAEI